MRTELLRFNTPVERDPAIEAWLELGDRNVGGNWCDGFLLAPILV
jgi:hypothetical protein